MIRFLLLLPCLVGFLACDGHSKESIIVDDITGEGVVHGRVSRGAEPVVGLAMTITAHMFEDCTQPRAAEGFVTTNQDGEYLTHLQSFLAQYDACVRVSLIPPGEDQPLVVEQSGLKMRDVDLAPLDSLNIDIDLSQ